MLKELNVEEIKRYNESLKEHKERASNLRAKVEFNTAELNRLCEELSKELSLSVTPDNLESIFNERVDKINNTLKTGKDILRRIEDEETRGNSDEPLNVDESSVNGAFEQPAIQQPAIQQPAIQQPAINNQASGPIFEDLGGGNDIVFGRNIEL